MSSNYSSSRRGPRPQSGRRPNSSAKKSGRPSAPYAAKPAKISLWGKLLGLIGLGNKKSSFQKKSTRPKTERSSEGKERTPRVSRKPEYVEVTSARLYIGNLSFDATESDLFELFSGVGQVQNIELVSNKDTHRSKGFGFVQMTSLEEAKRAVSELHDKEYMGRKLVVSGAKALPESRTESRSQAATEPEVSSEETSSGACCDHDSSESAH
jgi:RNA recognition motif-containing protein